MSFHLFFLADKYRCPLYFDTESNKLVKNLDDTIILPDQYKFVVKFGFSANSSVYINPYSGLLLSSSKNETRKVLDETTFFNSSVELDYSFIEVELKNFRVMWSNDSLVHIHSLDSKIMEKMNYSVKKGLFIHYSNQYIDCEANEIINSQVESLEQLKNPNIYNKKIIITLGFEYSNHSNIAKIINSNENLYYEINRKTFLQKFSSSAYYNNIGFLTFANISTLYINTLLSVKNLESALDNIEKKLLSHCLQNGINCILHVPAELNLRQILMMKNIELYDKNIWFIWSEEIQRKERYLATISDIEKFCPSNENLNHSNWKNAALEIMDTHFERILKEKKFAFSLIYSDSNEMVNPISRYNCGTAKENILPEFIISILTQLYLNKDLSKVLSSEILDFQIEDIQNEKYINFLQVDL